MLKSLAAILVSLTFVFTVPALASPSPDGTSHLNQVLKQGYVRVCTTGDYKPFTYLNPKTGKFQGIDIDMARNLAAALGVDVHFVKTSWSMLMKDFTAGKCDIAMGGISVNLSRQKKVYFSIPYFIGGKTPITRCDDVSKYQTLKQINQPGVTVIVNPGGTNERFARAHFTKAKIKLYKDNVTIFKQIAAGKADVMVTDAIETVLQAHLNPGLCAVHPDKPFTYSEKGYLLPQGDDVWQQFVNQWLHLAKATGQFQAIYDKWLQ